MGVGSEYPKMLYRPGSSTRVCNQYDVDLRTVTDAAEHEAAIGEGWSEHPAAAPPEEGKPKRRGRPRKDQS